jgi:hypothetical protein
MTPIQIGVLIFAIATIMVVWIKGGHPERLGACVYLAWTVASIMAPAGLAGVEVAEIPLFETALDMTVLAVFVGMSLKGGRWWPFAASAVMTLSVLVYLIQAFVPELDRRAEISAHVGLAAALSLTLLAGVGERWLAGESPVSAGQWRRRATSR